ncbi:MAG: 4-hydroxy-tetrahydrodipicolinate synthase [Desulfobulbaceae bacterium]|jgi:4-hydroxy-tetrahydrodipicolinate synthase|nr:4-hydroxy-tetrahydrodipicolinate synthase [Desulfobulbaceae bacterium]
MQRFHGAYTALITPFLGDDAGQVDEQGFIDLVNFQIERGIHGLVPVGTTGETATLSFDEHKRVVDLAVTTAAGRVPVIAGTGANSTAEAIEFSESAKKSGADATLSVVPYYNKPSQEGIYQHFRKIAEHVDIPMFLYNVPGRTVADVLPETVARLAQIDNIIGIKEATGNLARVSDVIRLCPKDFIVLSGDDFTALPSVFVGAKGLISVVSNIVPGQTAQLMQAALDGDLKRANELHYRLYPLMKCMFDYPSPAPVKMGTRLRGIIKNDLPRLPMDRLTEGNPTYGKLTKAMKELGIL